MTEMNAYSDINLDVTRFRVPGPTSRIDKPRTLDELNERLLDLEYQLQEASNLHLEYSLLHAQHIGEYEAEYKTAYAKSAGIDLSKPVWEQKQGKKRGENGTVDEHHAYAVRFMGKKYEQLETLKALVKAWEIRQQTVEAMISALQSIANNLRTEARMSYAPD